MRWTFWLISRTTCAKRTNSSRLAVLSGCASKTERSSREITEGPDAVAVQVFPVVIVTSAAADMATFEEPLQLVQDMHGPGSLDHAEVRLNLPTETTTVVPEDRNTEAAFAVDEADDPLLESWPFLLIVRTGRIVTAHDTTLKKGCDSERVPPDTRSFQHIAELFSSESPRWGRNG